jgi:hypothetical protein
MNQPWLLIVGGIVTLFTGGGLATLVLIPANRRAIAARGQFEIVQANVLWAKELKDEATKAKDEVEQLRGRLRQINDELDAEISRRRAAENRLAEWERMHPPPTQPGAQI